MNKLLLSGAALTAALAKPTTGNRTQRKHYRVTVTKWVRLSMERLALGGRFAEPDVIDTCPRCSGPIFNQSKNVVGTTVAGAWRKYHLRCPQKVAA